MLAYTWCNKHPYNRVPNLDMKAVCPICGDSLDKAPDLPIVAEPEPIELDLD